MIEHSDSDDDRRIPPSHTEETLLSAGPGDESAATTSGEPRSKADHSSSDEGNDASKSSGRMAKLFGKGKKKDGKDKTKEKKEQKEDKKEKEKKEKEKKEKKEREKKEKEEKEKEKKEKKEPKEKKDKKESEPKEKKKKEEKERKEDEEEKDKSRDRSPQRMPGFGKLGGFFRRHKKDSNTSNDSDITPPKLTSTPPSHRYPPDDAPRDISSDAPHDQTFPQSEHSGATSAAATSDVFDEMERVPQEEMDLRTRFRGPPPETIPDPMSEPLGYVPPPMVPVSDAHVPPTPEDTTAPKDVPYTYSKTKMSFSDKIRAPLNKLLVDKRPPKFQQGDGIAELNPPTQSPISRCSTFTVALLVAGFILGIILTAMGSMSTTLAVVGPCFIGTWIAMGQKDWHISRALFCPNLVHHHSRSVQHLVLFASSLRFPVPKSNPQIYGQFFPWLVEPRDSCSDISAAVHIKTSVLKNWFVWIIHCLFLAMQDSPSSAWSARSSLRSGGRKTLSRRWINSTPSSMDS